MSNYSSSLFLKPQFVVEPLGYRKTDAEIRSEPFNLQSKALGELLNKTKSKEQNNRRGLEELEELGQVARFD